MSVKALVVDVVIIVVTVTVDVTTIVVVVVVTCCFHAVFCVVLVPQIVVTLLEHISA